MSAGRSIRRLALVAGATALAVSVGRSVARKREAMARVAPDLRSPALYLFPSITNDVVRRSINAVQPLVNPPVAAGVTVEQRFAECPDGHRVPILVYEPQDRTRPSAVLLWIHGGGLVIGGPEQNHPDSSAIADELGILVVSVGYRLAPDHPFPAPLDDCAAALAWIHEQAADLGIDPDRVVVGGDSAGGGLAAALCQRARDEGGPPVAFQLLVYPMLDDRTTLRDAGGRGAFVWTQKANRFGWSAYLGHEPSMDPIPPHAAAARADDLAGLPPAWIGVGDADLFHDEDVAYARRLEEAGVPCALHVAPGMYHAAERFLPKAPTAQAFRADMMAALREAVDAAP